MTAAVDERRRARLKLIPPEGGDAAALREAFRARWLATAPPGEGEAVSPTDEAGMTLLLGVLFERIGEAVQDVEDGRSDLLGHALGGALDAVDRLDEALADIESWIMRLKDQQGVTLPAREVAP